MSHTRMKLIAGNWKMNLGHDEARQLAADISAGATDTATAQIAVFPPFPWLVPVRDSLGDSGVRLGAQNCHAQPAGAFTGEVSANMLQGLCDYVIVGHSERRHVFGESDQVVAEKASAVLATGLGLVLCVGETLDERDGGAAEQVVCRQLQVTYDALGARLSAGDITVAYEPVWAIGTGVAATADDAQQMCSTIRVWLRDNISSDNANRTRVLYGGSVTPANAFELLSRTDIDGALVGGASLKADSFLAIVSAAHAVTTS